jgi:hypothetical protein
MFFAAPTGVLECPAISGELRWQGPEEIVTPSTQKVPRTPKSTPGMPDPPHSQTQ